MSLEQTIDRVLSARTPKHDTPSSGEVIARWKSEVERLYSSAQEWINPYVEAGKMTIERKPHDILEENLGTYAIDVLDFDVGDETIRLQPQATRVIGAHGRVDMFRLGSANDPLLLVLTGDDHNRAWNIVDQSARTKLYPLTKDSFENAVERLFDEFSAHPGRVA